jgi:hypothetical protein
MKSHVVAGGIFRRGRIHALTITVFARQPELESTTIH